MEYYSGSFADRYQNQYEVCIIDTASREDGYLGRVTLGSTPFVVSNDVKEDEVMQPVITQSAKLVILQTASQILPLTSNTRWRVEIVKNQEEELVWAGYITSETISQPWDGMLNEVTYNLVDDMTAMKYTNTNLNGTEFMILEYLSRHLNSIPATDSSIHQSETVRYLYIGNNMPTVTSNGKNALLVKTSKSAWLEEDDDATINYLTVYDVVEEFMRIMGLTMWSDGVNWFISTVNDTSYKRITLASLLSESAFTTALNAATSTSIVHNTFSSIQFVDEQEFSVRQACKSVKVESGGENFDNVIPELKPENLTKYNVGEYTAYNTDGKKYPWFAVHYISNTKHGIKLYRYTVSKTKMTSTTEAKSDSDILRYGGACFMHEDYYDTEMSEDTGSVSDDEVKRNYSFHDRLYLIQSQLSTTTLTTMSANASGYRSYNDAIVKAKQLYDSLTSYPMVKFTKSSGMTVSSGGFCISFKLKNPKRDYVTKSGLRYRGPADGGRQASTVSIICKLRVGNKFWNGSEWTTTESRFEVDVAPGTGFKENNNTKLLTELYTCNGYSIPINSTISGEVELIIYGDGYYGAEEDSDEGGTQGYIPYANRSSWLMIENFKLEYCEAIGELKDELEGTYEKEYKVPGGAGEEHTIKCKMNSDVGILENPATLHIDDNILGSITTATQTGKPEVCTFNTAKSLYGVPRQYHEVNVLESTMPNVMGGMTYNSETYVRVTRKEYDMRTDVSKYLLLKKQ